MNVRGFTIHSHPNHIDQMGCVKADGLHTYSSLSLLFLFLSLCVCAFDRIKVLSVNEKVINFILPLNRGLPNKSLFLSLSLSLFFYRYLYYPIFIFICVPYAKNICFWLFSYSRTIVHIHSVLGMYVPPSHNVCHKQVCSLNPNGCSHAKQRKPTKIKLCSESFM